MKVERTGTPKSARVAVILVPVTDSKLKLHIIGTEYLKFMNYL